MTGTPLWASGVAASGFGLVLIEPPCIRIRCWDTPFASVQDIQGPDQASVFNTPGVRMCWKVPQHIRATLLQQDIIITTEVSRSLIMLELTVPWKECSDVANERKNTEYHEQHERCKEREEPLKSATGFTGHSYCKVLSRLSCTGVARGVSFILQAKPHKKKKTHNALG